MIAIKDNLPLIRFENGECAAFEPLWLVRSLVLAAQKAGYQNWWLAHHVAQSVHAYLLLQFEGNVMEAHQLSEGVQSVLQVIGYTEVAGYFEPLPPTVNLSLPEFARKAGSGYELAFFDMLGRKIQKLMAARATHLEMSGLERCVKQLRARKIWSRDCESLRSEIVCFVREQIVASAGPDREINLTLT